MKKTYLLEGIGTMVLVFFGCGAAVLLPAGNSLGVALAFGIAIIGMAYAIGPISGCHVNPAVTIGAWIAKRIELKDAIAYIIMQFIGATLGAVFVYFLVSGNSTFDVQTIGLAQNGFGLQYAGGYSLMSAILFEVIATFIFVFVILGVTSKGAENNFAGLVIGLTLTAALLVGMQITGGSLNPARSFGPALFVGKAALIQLWVFMIFPTIGAALAGVYYRTQK